MDTTGVGSLPHADPGTAARLAGVPSVPYLPQLPLRHPEEGMLRQWGDGLCGCGAAGSEGGLGYGAEPGPRAEAFVGAAAALDLLAGFSPPLVKTQATGPITLAAAMRAGGHPGDGLWDCVVSGLSGRVAGHLARIASRLPAAGIVVVFDEPALVAVRPGAPGAGAALAALSEVVSGVEGARVGVHCCGDADWGTVAEVGAHWLSMDAAALGHGFVEGATRIAGAVSSGARIIWGAVPTDPLPLPSVETLVARVRRAEGLLVLAGADVRVLDGALVSPACGLAGMTVEAAVQVTARVEAVAEALS